MINPNKDYFVRKAFRCVISSIEKDVYGKVQVDVLNQYGQAVDSFSGYTDSIEFKASRFEKGETVYIWCRFGIISDSYKIVRITKRNA